MKAEEPIKHRMNLDISLENEYHRYIDEIKIFCDIYSTNLSYITPMQYSNIIHKIKDLFYNFMIL